MTATSPWIELSLPAKRRVPRRLIGFGPLLLGILLAGLALSALRVHVTELRYRRAEALQQEERLQDEQRRLTVEVQGHKDPMRLKRQALAQGFVSPERVIELGTGTRAQ
jgi:cell division protein FtsL